MWCGREAGTHVKKKTGDAALAGKGGVVSTAAAARVAQNRVFKQVKSAHDPHGQGCIRPLSRGQDGTQFLR